MYPHRSTIALVLLAALPSPAQDTPAARSVLVRAISFQVDQPIGEVYAHSAVIPGKEDAPGVPLEVKSYLNHEGGHLVLHGEQVVFTGSSDRASIRDPKDVLAKARIPDSLRSAVVMFLPGSGKPGEPAYRVLPIDDSAREFPRGSFKIINLSPRELRVVLEKTVYTLRKGETRVIRDPPVNERNSSAMRAFNLVDGEWRSIGATAWPHPGKKRVIHVAFLNPDSKKVEFRGLRDIAVRDRIELPANRP